MQNKPENLPDSLMHSVINGYTADALADFGESMLDDLTNAVIDSDIVTDIPVIKSIVGLGKASVNFRDRRYLSKLVSFLSETAKASPEDKAKYREKLDKNPEECKKAGQTILDIIDKITSTQKAIMVGKVFRAFMHEEGLTTAQLVTLCEMIEKGYVDDLIELSKKEDGRWNDAHLESVGIKKPMRVEDINKAINAAMARMLKQMPVIREGSINDEEEPQVVQSGFTEPGDLLRRILQTY